MIHRSDDAPDQDMAMLTVWGRKTSSNVQATMWCIGELGLQYQRHDIGHRFGGTDTQEFIAMNPNRTVPVLQDVNSPPIWETSVILRYLANRYADNTFWPKDLQTRTTVDQWAEWSKINIAIGFTVPIFWRVVKTPERDRDPEAIRNAITELERDLKIAEQRLAQHGYLVGDEFTLADIQFGHLLYRYYDIGIKRADLPALAAYFARLSERPAYQEHVIISYEELRVS